MKNKRKLKEKIAFSQKIAHGHESIIGSARETYRHTCAHRPHSDTHPHTHAYNTDTHNADTLHAQTQTHITQTDTPLTLAHAHNTETDKHRQ